MSKESAKEDFRKLVSDSFDAVMETKRLDERSTEYVRMCWDDIQEELPILRPKSKYYWEANIQQYYNEEGIICVLITPSLASSGKRRCKK